MITEAQELLSKNHLRWACRRGMLELDILLGDFVDKKCFDELSLEEKYIFQDLLLESDQDLHGFFMSQVKPESEVVANVIEKIRRAAAS
ncbi:MAG: succinate dehydrogenase assembly factor 2 [Gammaproteobacteria bacterium]|nr:succinate dehydrogenase assembly factor 2 [Gammaproteobacteria bacterium]